MPIIKSAKKRVRTARKAAARNLKTKRVLKSSLKTFQTSVTDGKKVGEAQAAAQSALGLAGKKGIMHKNKVARKQRQLAAAAKAAGTKIQKTATKTVKKTVPKSASQRTTAKSAVKKAPKKTTKK